MRKLWPKTAHARQPDPYLRIESRFLNYRLNVAVRQMVVTLNRCKRCKGEIGPDDLGYFRLNDRTDRFDLECESCYRSEEIELSELALH